MSERKPVDELSGRELDAAVAEGVMGCRLLRDDGALWCLCDPDVGRQGVRPHAIPDGPQSGELKRYSTDIAAAWEVVERVVTIDAERGMFRDFVLEFEAKKAGRAIGGRGGPGAFEHDGSLHWYCRIESAYTVAGAAPLAISRAALKAVRASREGSE